MTTVNFVTTGVAKEDHNYQWKIENFEMVQKNEKLVAEQKFEMNTGPKSACHSFWNVGMKMSSGGSHIGFYCKLVGIPGADDDVEVPMGFSLTVKYRDGNAIRKSILNTLKLGGSCSFENVWTFNWPDWNRYTASDGSITVNVILTIYAPVKSSKNLDIAMETFTTKFVTKLQDNLASLLIENNEDVATNDNNELADVKIVSSDEKVFHCHKLILAARSPYFATLFRSGFSESNTGIIKVEDLSSKTIKVLLHYIYTGKLLETWLEPDVIVEFTYAAGKYQFTEILELLDNLLGTAHDEDTPAATNVILLELANKLSLKKAEAELLKRIVKFTVNAGTSDEFLFLIGNQ